MYHKQIENYKGLSCWCNKCKQKSFPICSYGNVFICNNKSSSQIGYNSSTLYYEYRSCLRKVRFCNCCHTYQDVINHPLVSILSKDVKTESENYIFLEGTPADKDMIIVGDNTLTKIPHTNKVKTFHIYNCQLLTSISNNYKSNTQWLKQKEVLAENYAPGERERINAVFRYKIKKLTLIQKRYKWKFAKKILLQRVAGQNDKAIVDYIGTFYL